MRINILLFLLLTVGATAQTILSDNFNNFFPDTSDARILAIYIMDETNYPGTAQTDHSTNGLDATETAATGGQEQNNNLFDSGYAEDFNASGTYSITGGATLNMTGSFSFFVSFYKDDLSGTEYILSHDNGGANRQWNCFVNGNSLRFTIFGNATNGDIQYTISDSVWYNVVGIYDSSGTPDLDLYINGVSGGTPTGSTGSISQLNSIEATPTRISGIANGSIPFAGDIAAVAIYDTVLSAQDAQELGQLANGWVSKNGNVTRGATEFFQTLWDTVGIPINSSAENNYTISVRAKSSDATKTLKAWIGSAATAKSTVGSKTLTASWADYTMDVGSVALSSDTLWFASNALTDTVSIDNVTLSVTTAETADSRYKRYDSFSGFKGW